MQQLCLSKRLICTALTVFPQATSHLHSRNSLVSCRVKVVFLWPHCHLVVTLSYFTVKPHLNSGIFFFFDGCGCLVTTLTFNFFCRQDWDGKVTMETGIMLGDTKSWHWTFNALLQIMTEVRFKNQADEMFTFFFYTPYMFCIQISRKKSITKKGVI